MSENTYFVLGNLKHNGKDYQRGDEIILEDKQAQQLLEAKVVSTKPVSAVAEKKPEEKTEVEPSRFPTVGGERPKSGEPSVDGKDAPQSRPASFIGKIFGGNKESNTEERVTESESNQNADSATKEKGSEVETEQRDPSQGL